VDHASRLGPCRVRSYNAGEDNPASTLTEARVKEIRSRYKAGGFTYITLAEEYSLALSTVGDILTRRRWKHI